MTGNAYDLIKHSKVFDEFYYLENNEDVKKSGVDPIEHYLLYGEAEGRSPSAIFCPEAYKLKYPDVSFSGLSPIIHYICYGQAMGRPMLQMFKGLQYSFGKKTVLLVGHAARLKLYGAERSLIDVLKALNELRFKVIVALPHGENEKYINEIKRLSFAVFIFPFSWWKNGKEINKTEIDTFSGIIKKFNIDVVHANTIVHGSPLVAAKENNVKVIIHVREIVELDDEVCNLLNASPADIYRHAQSYCHLIIANSEFTNSKFNSFFSCVVKNTVNVKADKSLRKYDGKLLSVALIGDGNVKKGTDDFVELAILASKNNLNAKFNLIGVSELNKLRLNNLYSVQELENLSFFDYQDEILDVLNSMDVVLNLSHCQETFSRVVAESMGLGKVVIAYRWGAIPELIEHGFNGYLVPFGCIDEILEYLFIIQRDDSLYSMIANNAEYFASTNFEFFIFKEGMKKAYIKAGIEIDI